ncbi:MAG TPA: helix-turn-helix domain-containing protein [Vicinamibacterales bacterium]|nr:helix-turn-helix domain-containing protein [Vicinamibacterales bacterium]
MHPRSLKRTRRGEAGTRLVLATFRLNGLLLNAGDELAAPEQLTSTRWQVLGAIALTDGEVTVSQIARRMGLTRQSVHATVKHLLGDGLVELVRNPDHRRSPFLRLTRPGQAKYGAMERRQVPWINRLAGTVPPGALATAIEVLERMSQALEPFESKTEGT